MALDVAELDSTPPFSPSKLFKSSPSKNSPLLNTNNFPSISTYSTSFSTLHESLHESPHIFDFSEINAATNNFLTNRHTAASSTPSWRCTLQGKDVIIFQRKFQPQIGLQQFKDRFYKICLCHHTSIIQLLGISISSDYLYLVYNFVNGANLSDCLRNSKSPNFTVLSTWISRMQVATDLAHGLDYIHNKSGINISLTHNHIKSSSIIVTEPSFNARICHFGVAQLCNEDDWNKRIEKPLNPRCINGEIGEDSKKKLELKDKQAVKSKKVQIKGVRGYMAPEYKSSGVASPMTDVYAFGVVILELLTGEEPVKFEFDRRKGNFVRVSLIESAMAVIEEGGDDVEGRLRKWVDRRLKDSFPIHVAEKITRLAIKCVDVDPAKRPSMSHVASKISKLYIESRIWSDNRVTPANLSISLAPR
ncbi:lysM domain receptor-like kinase 3 [Benincasa hispida]|uniref:lysM domain receptor-like kinase 3 n=1 Tax=Benincasa hispida TaxID=102211 RepID=UPI0018FF90C9|nr:lysM domain receptor-like kinase 3 [Benincasa hispida]